VDSSTSTKVLNSEYLKARGDAWDAGCFCEGHPFDPVLTDFRGDETQDTLLWLAFMAGSDWERKYRGSRYVEGTGTLPSIDPYA
jgi:hypothetical protein